MCLVYQVKTSCFFSTHHDVLGGFLVGTLWLIVSISLTEWLSARGKIIWQIPGSAMQTYTVSLSIILVLLAALIYAEVYQFPLLA